MVVRRITVELDTPTRDGEAEIHILTNLPAGRRSMVECCLSLRHPVYHAA